MARRSARELLQDFGIEIGTSFGPLAGKIWRIGTMGYVCRKSNVLRCLTALEAVLRRNGVRLPAGAAVDAAYEGLSSSRGVNRSATHDRRRQDQGRREAAVSARGPAARHQYRARALCRGPRSAERGRAARTMGAARRRRRAGSPISCRSSAADEGARPSCTRSTKPMPRRCGRMLAGDPVLVDVIPAGRPLKGLTARTSCTRGRRSAGSACAARCAGPCMGIAVFEGWAKRPGRRRGQGEAGAFRFEPNHHYDAVGSDDRHDHAQPAGAGGREPRLRQPRLLRDQRGPRQGHALRRQRRRGARRACAGCATCSGPALGRAIRETGGIPLKPIIARGLTMGDEMHQRNVACSSLLLRLLAPALARTAKDSEALGTLPRFHRPERPVLPQRGDGDGQGHHRSRRAASRARPSSPP